MNIGSIIWPADAKQASNLYLEFVLGIVENVGVTFPNPPTDPIAAAKGYVAGTVSPADYDAAAASWWAYLDSVDGLRKLRNKEVLTARLALCLLSARTEVAPDLGEHLSWFLELLGIMDLGAAGAVQKMAAHFPHRPE